MKMPQYHVPEHPFTFIKKKVAQLLLFPYTLVQKYNDYNSRIGEIVNEINDEDLNRIRKNNGKLVLIFVYLPLCLGAVLGLISIYIHFHEFVEFFSRILKPVQVEGLIAHYKVAKAKIMFTWARFPARKSDYMPLVYGYLCALVGAKFLAMNPAFHKEEEITKVFAHLGYIDGKGEPWVVTWTPEAVMIVSFHCDPIALTNNTRFWSTINFPPGIPKIFKSNMNKFIVQRAYELPPTIVYSFDELR
jgi:hypothetical protein